MEYRVLKSKWYFTKWVKEMKVWDKDFGNPEVPAFPVLVIFKKGTSFSSVSPQKTVEHRFVDSVEVDRIHGEMGGGVPAA